MKTGCPIIYSSDDSVLQVAAHEDIVPPQELYDMCKIIRDIVSDEEYKIGRVIARPFTGKVGEFVRTNKRKDFALDPPINVIDILSRNGINTIKELLKKINPGYFKGINDDNLDRVLDKDEKFEYNWKFNLSGGATIDSINDKDMEEKLINMLVNKK